MTNILAKIVQNEVGGGLGLTGADKLKLYTAQAVAANSWLQYQYAHGITAPEVGLKTVTDSSIYTAVEEAQKYVVTYNGEAACTVYGSASGTMTNSSERMGWGALPYLVSVKSKYESSFGSKYQGYTIQNKISTATMKNSIEKMLGAGATNGYPTSQWLQNPVFDSNGYCISIQVCGKTVNGGKFYENCYNLLSPKFEIIENGENGVWVFKTWGNGHCVGMSQYGAAWAANHGIGYREILGFYYVGAKIAANYGKDDESEMAENTTNRALIPFTNEHFVAFLREMVGRPYWYGTCIYKCMVENNCTFTYCCIFRYKSS